MNWWRNRRPQEAIEPAANHTAETETSAAKPDPILAMQRTVGNRAVQRLLPRSEGEPIAEGERGPLESAFGQDLGEVRIHRDDEAADLAAAADANAFTVGRDIYFAAGAYGAPALAHEVTHIIQQSNAPSVLPGEDASLEQQAGAASAAFLARRPAELGAPGPAPALQRQPAPGTQPSSLRLLPSESLTLDSFDIDQSTLSGAHKLKLEQFARQLKAILAAAPDSLITIVGFADAPGTEPHNLELGQRRADAVRDRLVAAGIPGNQLHTASLGEASPVVDTKRYEAKNRRVEINVIERSLLKPSIVTPAPPPAPAPAPAPPAEKPKIDLNYHPKEQDPTPDEELQERMRLIDKAVQEAQEAEKARPGTSAADLAGRVLRDAARKLGLPKWVQDRAESLGKDLPSKGGQAIVDQIAGDKSLDTNTQSALKALVDALMRTKVK